MTFQPTTDQMLDVSTVTAEMVRAGLPRDFVADVDRMARAWEGVYDLMMLWRDAPDAAQRSEVEADLHEAMNDIVEAPPTPEKKPYVPFDDLDAVARHVLAFKKRLRALIDQHGGVTEVARRSGIPQPSLSRMLSSASMPRRTTLYKIANAIGAREAAIVTEWVR
jgi:DNA-binding phage protein